MMLDKIMKGKKVWKRTLAGVLSAAMVFSGLGGVFPASIAKAADITYTFDAANDNYGIKNLEKQAAITDGTEYKSNGVDEYVFTVSGATRSNSSTISIELNKNTGKLEFKVTEGYTAIVNIWASSTGSNTSDFGLYTEKNNAIKNSAGSTTSSVTGASFTQVTFNDVEEGDYYFKPITTTNNRAFRIQKITVELTKATLEGTAPTVGSASVSLSENSNIATVTWDDAEGGEGSGDGKYNIYYSKNGGEYTLYDSVKLDGEKNITYAITSSGTYKFKVCGALGKVETEAKETDEVAYVLPLAKPVLKASAGNAKVSLSWDTVSEATSYTINVYDSNGLVNDKTVTGISGSSKSKDIEGLTNGQEYSFEIIAIRNNDSSTSDKVFATPAAPVDTSAAIPGLSIVDQSDSNSVVIVRNDGTINAYQPASSGGIGSTTTNTSFIMYPTALTTDFTMSADVTISTVAENTTYGVFIGAFNNTNSDNKFVSLGLRGKNQDVNLYKSKASGRGGSALSTLGSWVIGKTYTLTMKRSGDSYTVTVSDGTSNDSKTYNSNAGNSTNDVTQLQSGQPVYPAIALAGVSAEIKNLKITASDNSVLYDSTTLTGSYIPFSDNWQSVEAPVITGVNVKNDGSGEIEVKVKAEIGVYGAGTVTVNMSDAQGKVVGTADVSTFGQSSETFTFKPTASGIYTFTAISSRPGESTTKTSDPVTASDKFILPMAQAVISSVTNSGNGSVTIDWAAVPEAESYIVYQDGVQIGTTSSLSFKATGLTIGQSYSFSVAAVHGNDVGKQSEALSIKATAETQRKWLFTWYGASTNSANNGYSGNINDGSVTVWSENGKGKIVPNSRDGLAFYYTTIDPDTENFTLEADITVDRWTYSNGQEGFGMMVADTIGNNSDTQIWNNTIQNIVSKVEYYYNSNGVTTDTTASKITMRLGVGALVRLGATKDDLLSNSIPATFTTETTTLETSCGALGTGNYNIVGNCTNDATGSQTTFHMSITRNNTGYFVKYMDAAGNLLGEKKVYDYDRNALTQIDSDNIYVGFFASRNARITVKNMNFTTIAPEDDDPPEERPIEYVVPSYSIESATFSSTEQYDLVYYGNADGHLYITNDAGEVVADEDVKASSKVTKSVSLNLGSNVFTVKFTPNADYQPAAYTKLSSYDTVTFTHKVTLSKAKEQTNLYVSPNGTSSAKGTKSSPLDIYTAVKIAAPGQKIILMEGTYNLTSTVKVERGINGEEDNLIYMIADPQASTRPVLDFGGNCAGMILAGDYWYFQGFDVTKSADAQKGIQVSGSHNTLDDIRTYRNGNTGIQISRYKSSDERDQWPSYNLILNCSSYLNADKGYEDADGFAAKLTVGDGNVFDGCISAYNADDGWDCYAKVETGSIGKVTIQNSVAFMNGYVLDENGTLINAGNGNGFKMGGDSMSGYHTLINSVAFDNKAKGIDSNSCPDIQVYNSISFNNTSYNVAFYTNTATNTDFFADSVVSYKTSNSIAEQFKPLGTQDKSKYIGTTNYFTYDKENSYNSNGDTVSADWFESLDTASVEAAFAKAILSNSQKIAGITRNSDGTINMNGLLVLTDKAPVKAGLYSTAVTGSSSSLNIDTTNMRAVVRYSLEDSLTDAVREKTGASDSQELKEYVMEKLLSSVNTSGALKNAVIADTSVFEVKVQISEDGGDTWVDVTKDNFPAKGITVTLPYPDGTEKNGYNFAVGHLIVMGINGKTPGEMEIFTGSNVTKSSFGIRVHIMSASPFVIAYEKNNANTNEVDDDEDGENAGLIALAAEKLAGKKTSTGYPNSPKTFDDGTSPVPVLDILPDFSYDNMAGKDTTGVTQNTTATTTSDSSTFSPLTASKAVILTLVAIAVAGIAGAGVLAVMKRRKETNEQ